MVPHKKPSETKEIVDKIYILESSGGKYDSCVDRKLGYNGYGFGIHKTAYNCYDSRERVKGYVTAWVQDKLNQGYSLANLLCTYNLGPKHEHLRDCINKSNQYPYYKNYLKLN